MNKLYTTSNKLYAIPYAHAYWEVLANHYLNYYPDHVHIAESAAYVIHHLYNEQEY